MTTEKAQEDETSVAVLHYKAFHSYSGLKHHLLPLPTDPSPKISSLIYTPSSGTLSLQLCSCTVNSLAQPLDLENNTKKIIFQMDSSSVVPEWPHKQLCQHNWCSLVRGRIRQHREEATALAEGAHSVTAL